MFRLVTYITSWEQSRTANWVHVMEMEKGEERCFLCCAYGI
jgi:hypothetical protein